MANGIIIIDKPADWTSMDVCAKLRGILKTKKVGHAGTLDPMATGVLPVFVGQATRGVSFAEIRGQGVSGRPCGWALSPTRRTPPGRRCTGRRQHAGTRAALEAVLPRFTGEISQLPPMYSAIKIGGKKLYELARQREGGGAHVPGPSPSTPWSWWSRRLPDDYVLRVRCSKGTYVRTLCHDIGQALGCGGCMAALRRTMAAGFTLVRRRDAGAGAGGGRGPAAAGGLPVPGSSGLLCCRTPVGCGPLPQRQSRLRVGAAARRGEYRVYDPEGDFLCLSRLEGGVLTSIKNFFGA